MAQAWLCAAAATNKPTVSQLLLARKATPKQVKTNDMQWLVVTE